MAREAASLNKNGDSRDQPVFYHQQRESNGVFERMYQRESGRGNTEQLERRVTRIGFHSRRRYAAISAISASFHLTAHHLNDATRLERLKSNLRL